jgi:gamma-butyrobetaine dioxygenase
MHIDAKRYLCATEPDYHDRLSTASRYTLTKQGGPMTNEEAARFLAHPYADDSLRLRRYEDEHGKRTGVEIPPLSHFESLLERQQIDRDRR